MLILLFFLLLFSTIFIFHSRCHVNFNSRFDLLFDLIFHKNLSTLKPAPFFYNKKNFLKIFIDLSKKVVG